ncbi:unnamed protein product [Closterium sp. Yama58-4]|nr:unnamed protein product [Closterium sp. Yama58-4]
MAINALQEQSSHLERAAIAVLQATSGNFEVTGGWDEPGAAAASSSQCCLSVEGCQAAVREKIASKRCANRIDAAVVESGRIMATTDTTADPHCAESADAGGAVDDATKGGAGEIAYHAYRSEEADLAAVMRLVQCELSEPYSVFTYRYFLHHWPHLTFLARAPRSASEDAAEAAEGEAEGRCVGAVVCKMEAERAVPRGYIAMLVVAKEFRGRRIATSLVSRCIEAMRDAGCAEVVLEAEVTNEGALALYGNLGFIRAKLLHRYYLNGSDAFRLKLLLPSAGDAVEEEEEQAAVAAAMGAGAEQQPKAPATPESHAHAPTPSSASEPTSAAASAGSSGSTEGRKAGAKGPTGRRKGKGGKGR